jgi:hypothetical protein
VRLNVSLFLFCLCGVAATGGAEGHNFILIKVYCLLLFFKVKFFLFLNPLFIAAAAGGVEGGLFVSVKVDPSQEPVPF